MGLARRTQGAHRLTEIKAYLKRAHAVIAAALPKKKQAELGYLSPLGGEEHNERIRS